jgi:hypothetical protein
MDASISVAPGGKAAAASIRAKRVVLLACALLGVVLYASQERRHAAAASRLGAAHPDMQQLVSRYALQGGAPAAVTVHGLFYDKKGAVYCGEVNGQTRRGAEVKFKEGVRIFVCRRGPPD